VSGGYSVGLGPADKRSQSGKFARVKSDTELERTGTVGRPFRI